MCVPIIQHNECGFGQGIEEFDVAAVAMGDAQFIDQARHATIQDRVSLPAGLLRECAGDPDFLVREVLH